MVKLWTRCLCSSDGAKFKTLTEALRHQGAQLQSDADADFRTNGLICVDVPGEELFEILRQSALSGRPRPLVACLQRESIPSGFIWSLLEAGARDVLLEASPADLAEAIVARLHRYEAVEELLHSPEIMSGLIGQGPSWLCALRQVVEIASFTDSSLLITGESGTGKELIARLIHRLDARRNKKELIVLDCTTVVPELAGSEFFGHERGAFTHAFAPRDGAFALADGGTLFLDEVGELPLTLQAELLRVLQEHTYKRVGGNTWRETSFRLVSATNRDLVAAEAQGRIRRDFYHRVATWTCRLPPLRDRREDILPLARHFLKQELPESADTVDFDPAIADFLRTRAYPGNVRELKHLVGRLAKRHTGNGAITAGDLPDDEREEVSRLVRSDWVDEAFRTSIRLALAQGATLRDVSNRAANVAVEVALQDVNGNLRQAARKLGVTDRALQLRQAAQRSAATPVSASAGSMDGNGAQSSDGPLDSRN